MVLPRTSRRGRRRPGARRTTPSSSTPTAGRHAVSQSLVFTLRDGHVGRRRPRLLGLPEVLMDRRTCPRALGPLGRLRPRRPVPAVRRGAVAGRGARGHARRRPPGLPRPRATPRPVRRSRTPTCPRTCTPRSPATARSSPRACPARRSPGTCSASTGPTTPGCAASPPRPSPEPGCDALEPRVRALAAELLDALEHAGAPGRRSTSSPASPGPLPFAVLGELLGLPREDQRRLAGWFATLLAPSAGPEPPAAAVAASEAIVGYLTDLVDATVGHTRRGPRRRPRPRLPGRTAHPPGAALDPLPARRRRARHDDQPHRQRRHRSPRAP